MLTMTCFTRGSSARHSASSSRSSAILSSLDKRLDRIDRGIQRRARSRSASGLPTPFAPLCAIARAEPAASSSAGSTISSEYAKPVFSPRQRAHADALLDRVIAVLDDAVLEHPGLAARMLEIEIGRVDRRAGQARETRSRSFAERPPGRSRRCSACVMSSVMSARVGIRVRGIGSAAWHLRAGRRPEIGPDTVGHKRRSAQPARGGLRLAPSAASCGVRRPAAPVRLGAACERFLRRPA